MEMVDGHGRVEVEWRGQSIVNLRDTEIIDVVRCYNAYPSWQ
jgi:hypothetical protein